MQRQGSTVKEFVQIMHKFVTESSVACPDVRLCISGLAPYAQKGKAMQGGRRGVASPYERRTVATNALTLPEPVAQEAEASRDLA